MIIDLINTAVTSIQVDNEPYYSYGTWTDEAFRLSLLNDITAKQGEKFPLVFLLLYKGFKENYIESENSFESDLRIFILDRTKLVQNTQRRNEEEMPALRTIETNLLAALKIVPVKFLDYDREEYMYAENELNTPVNSIELGIPATYQIFC
jgi:hypothetical protein